MPQRRKSPSPSGHASSSKRPASAGTSSRQPRKPSAPVVHSEKPGGHEPAPHRTRIPAPASVPPSEYRLLITPRFNEREQKNTTMVLLTTTQAFASFQYELSVQERVDGHVIHYRVVGLKAPQISLPAAGHAKFTREYSDMNGAYEFTIEGLDGQRNTFLVHITPDRVQVKKAPPQPFVEIYTDAKTWSDIQ